MAYYLCVYVRVNIYHMLHDCWGHRKASGATVPGHYGPLVYVGAESSGRALWSAGATTPHPLWREGWKSHIPHAEVALCSPCILLKLLPLPSSSSVVLRAALLCCWHPGVSGSVPRWRSGQAGEIIPSQHSQHSESTVHIQQWQRRDSRDPGEG